MKLTEAGLFQLWHGQRFPDGALVTRDGVPVRVVSPGRAGRGPGPDFRNAAIAAPSGVVVRGDVELHVRTSLFRAHGHAVDPAYGNVILHVVFDDDDARDTLLPGGRTAPVVALAPWVARRADELQRWLERPLLWREPCHDALTRLGRDGVTGALEAEGDRRLEARVERWRATIDRVGVEQAVYEGLLEALGYGGNAAAMVVLARAAPWSSISSIAAGGAAACAAVLLGVAGLLPPPTQEGGRVDPEIGGMARTFAASGLPPGRCAWKLWGIRPHNHPARRIAAAGALLARAGVPSTLLCAADASPEDAIRSLMIDAYGPWGRPSGVCADTAARPAAALIGRSRSLELLSNVVLPAAVAAGDAAASARARALFARLPRPGAYGRTKFIEQTLAGQDSRLRLNARRAQGLLALHNDWCARDGCGRCPLS